MNEETFLSALHDDPSDEVTWLALADWLEETGQGNRAELVRLGRRLRALPVMKRTSPRAEMEDRVAELLRAGVAPVVPAITNSVGMRLALIAPGRFRMGSPVGEKERRGSEKAHEVTLSRPFYLGIFTVTQQEYRTVVGSHPGYYAPRRPGRNQVKGCESRRFPVEQVTWADAVAFCKKLTKQESRPGMAYRLPSEAEWEYACRAGSSGAFNLGATLNTELANFNGARPYAGGSEGASLDRPREVGSYPPNAWGLYDMHGNVWEWCADWFADDYYKNSPAHDPAGPPTGSHRVIRGGCYYDNGASCRSAYRVSYGEAMSYRSLGFRVVLAASD